LVGFDEVSTSIFLDWNDKNLIKLNIIYKRIKY